MSFTYSTPELRYQRYYFAGKDIANIIETAKISAVSDIINLTDYGLDQSDENRTVLDVIGSLWTEGNISQAQNLTKEFFDTVLNRTNLQYELAFNNESIYSSTGNSSYFLSRLSTIVSGYEKTKPVNGYLARVYMTKVSKSNSYFSYLGGYVGDGNITKIITLPSDANITEVYMELNTGNNFTLTVNGNSVGSFVKTAVNFSADNWTVCSETVNPSYCSYFTQGDNIIEINFTEPNFNHIGGGYFKIIYKTSELTEGEYVYTGNTRTGYYYFPGINGILNLYSSFYVPGTLQNITVYLHYFNNLTLNEMSIPVYFSIGGEEIYNSNATGEQTITIPDYNISQIFGGKANLIDVLSNATIPIRFGTETFAFTSGEGASDSVLITDISGSMSTCDVNSLAGPCNCNAPAPCQRDRIEVAIEVDKEFVNTMVEYNGSRVGLVSYTTGIDEIHPLSNDTTSLEAQIDGYAPSSYTCISCGIASAVNMIRTSKIVDALIPAGSMWLYNTSYPSSDPPDVNNTDWKQYNYTDSGWDAGQAILGFENSPYSPNIVTDIGNNGGNYYFRKHFNITELKDLDFVELYV
ncbi:MAG: VWA domain-containing protein, partial [Candidatus Aenigmarchaeota archaeon]|nr:VWA domain-containing protein [Candidatus Aenigmarchaeota archaeon]